MHGYQFWILLAGECALLAVGVRTFVNARWTALKMRGSSRQDDVLREEFRMTRELLAAELQTLGQALSRGVNVSVTRVIDEELDHGPHSGS